VDAYFLVGAVLGSGLFITLGRPPAERLVQAAKELYRRRGQR
jgi:hypothetical protein